MLFYFLPNRSHAVSCFSNADIKIIIGEYVGRQNIVEIVFVGLQA